MDMEDYSCVLCNSGCEVTSFTSSLNVHLVEIVDIPFL